jgi:hypothetical protein
MPEKKPIRKQPSAKLKLVEKAPAKIGLPTQPAVIQNRETERRLLSKRGEEADLSAPLP